LPTAEKESPVRKALQLYGMREAWRDRKIRQWLF
jgi:hypothetical protein